MKTLIRENSSHALGSRSDAEGHARTEKVNRIVERLVACLGVQQAGKRKRAKDMPAVTLPLSTSKHRRMVLGRQTVAEGPLARVNGTPRKRKD